MRVHPEAAREARAARRWYSRRDPQAGARFLQEYRHAVAAIAAGPERWPRWLSARRCTFRRFPYSLVYHVASDGEVEILAVAHDRRRPGYWWQRRG